MILITRLFRIAGWLAVALILILSLVSGEARPHTISPSHFEHVLAYLATASALTLGYFGYRYVLRIAILLPTYGALLEIIQLWIPGRMGRLIDVAAGALGTWIGIGLILLLHWRTGVMVSSVDDVKRTLEPGP